MSALTFRVWCPDLGETEEEVSDISAPSAALAVEQWARDEDQHSAEYRIAGGRDEPTVSVRSPDGTVQTWTVMGEHEPVYYARAVQP